MARKVRKEISETDKEKQESGKIPKRPAILYINLFYFAVMQIRDVMLQR